MQVSLDKELHLYAIHAYDETGITLILPPHLAVDPSQRRLYVEHSLILSPHIHKEWQAKSFDGLKAEHLTVCLEYKPEVVLLGCGATMHFPGEEVLAPLYRQGVGVELMSTAAACRTFNILANEGRDVVALMLPPNA
ncbi:MAG: MTH938/NDUFAF3 family protein [Gammaproteobacteria bacterium]|nr:MTH938/NDUFAF3 family protein [Gammaproteobacteria bacterium]